MVGLIAGACSRKVDDSRPPVGLGFELCILTATLGRSISVIEGVFLSSLVVAAGLGIGLIGCRSSLRTLAGTGFVDGVGFLFSMVGGWSSESRGFTDRRLSLLGADAGFKGGGALFCSGARIGAWSSRGFTDRRCSVVGTGAGFKVGGILFCSVGRDWKSRDLMDDRRSVPGADVGFAVGVGLFFTTTGDWRSIVSGLGSRGSVFVVS